MDLVSHGWGGRFLFSGWFVQSVTIHCRSCGGQWKAAMTASVYEKQAVESCPCPFCAAYTLCCVEPAEHPLAKRHRHRSHRSAGISTR